MLVGNSLIGVLDLQSEQPDRFGADEARVLTSLAEQIGVSVRNAQLFAEAQAARHEAEQANHVKSQFLASMSHELRTPLNAILNFSQFVSSGMMGPVNDEQVDVLTKITASGKHLLSLINDVLDISKIESGALALFVEDNVNLSDELQTVIAAGKTIVGHKPVELSAVISDDLPLIVGDKRRVRQIMLNLVSNACKFTEEGHVRIWLAQRGDEILFTVEDTGLGIAPEDRVAVFETFRQTETGLRQSEGTGLGLPISKRLTEAHGGRLWFDSVEGHGSTFFVALPVSSPQLTAMIKSGARGKNGR
jgi:signal transduction histidine kinase